MTVNCSPFGPKPQFELSSGAPAVGYQLFFYAAGSVSTKQNTYTDSTGLTANPNPVVLNSLGQPINELWLTAGQAYKVVYAPVGDTDPPSSPIWTIDNLVGINDVTTTITDWIAGPTPTYTGTTTFTLLGDQTSNFHVGRRIKTINSGGTKYGTITSSVFSALTTVTVALDAGALDSGLSAVFYGLVSAINPSLPSSAAVHNTMGISAAIQKQTYTAFTTGGISTAYTLTPSPAIAANNSGTRFFATFHTAAGATPTLAVSGLAALPLKYRDSSGTLQAITSTQIPNGWQSDVETDGSNWIVLEPYDVSSQILSISSSVAGNALTLNYAGGTLDFRNANLVNGAPVSGFSVGALAITVPSAATLGTVNTVQARLALLVAYNAGTPVLCVVNLAGGNQLDETNLISPTTISAAATANNVIYSATAVAANSQYRVVGFVDITEATAGTWTSDATLKQGAGGISTLGWNSMGYGQTWQNVVGSRSLGTTYYNTTGRPITVIVGGFNSSSSNSIQPVVGGVTLPMSQNATAGFRSVTQFIVPPSQSYVVNNIAASATLDSWVELR